MRREEEEEMEGVKEGEAREEVKGLGRGGGGREGEREEEKGGRGGGVRSDRNRRE